jgi:hypothetical protein
VLELDRVAETFGRDRIHRTLNEAVAAQLGEAEVGV